MGINLSEQKGDYLSVHLHLVGVTPCVVQKHFEMLVIGELASVDGALSAPRLYLAPDAGGAEDVAAREHCVFRIGAAVGAHYLLSQFGDFTL